MKPLSSIEIWSALPTPLTEDLKVDVPSVERMIRDALAGGIKGVFLAGTCGEGPWLPAIERRRLVEAVAAEANGRLEIAVQTTDNSVPRIMENIHDVSEAGADYAIIAAPAVFMNATPDRMTAFFTEAVGKSCLPVGIYDLGKHRPVLIPDDRLMDVYLLPQVRFVKDSSNSPERRAIALAAREAKPTLRLFNGDEFNCLEYMEGGYNGFMFGGAVAVAPQLNQIASLFLNGRIEEAREVDAEMKRILFGIYGGASIACWLTGLKYYMLRRGLFSSTASFLGYPLTDECRSFIDDYAMGA